MAKQTTINAQVDKQTKATIQRMAKDAKVSVSDVVRWALQEYLRLGTRPQLPPKEQAPAA